MTLIGIPFRPSPIGASRNSLYSECMSEYCAGRAMTCSLVSGNAVHHSTLHAFPPDNRSRRGE